MPPRRRFNKKTAQTFSVVHRAHDDALYYDNDASAHVLVPAAGKSKPATNTTKIYNTKDLESQLSPEDFEIIRNNEGLAAQYGIFFDDSKYDYMKHLRPMGESDGVFIDAKGTDATGDKKTASASSSSGAPGAKLTLADLFADQVPSTQKLKVSHTTQQDIPDELKGFQPDMDPRLREVLEALEDEAYVEEDDDIFASLLESGQVEDEEEFYYGSDADQYYDDDYDEWDLDNYKDEYDQKYENNGDFSGDFDGDKFSKRPSERLGEFKSSEVEEPEIPEIPEISDVPVSFNDSSIPDVTNSSWQTDFKKFKSQSKNIANDWDSDDDFEEEDEVPDLPTFDGKKKKSKGKLRKKKGAMTDTSSFSMTSSALFRTEGLTLLDDRFEQLAKKFEEEEEEVAPTEFRMEDERNDLEEMLDDFLDNYELESGGRKLVKKNEDRKKLMEAADSVSKGKVAARRKKDKLLVEGMGDMKI